MGESCLHARADVLKLGNLKFYSKKPEVSDESLVCVTKKEGKS